MQKHVRGFALRYMRKFKIFKVPVFCNRPSIATNGSDLNLPDYMLRRVM
jgi:hypothetical protein